jgi:hypothetical protein
LNRSLLIAHDDGFFRDDHDVHYDDDHAKVDCTLEELQPVVCILVELQLVVHTQVVHGKVVLVLAVCTQVAHVKVVLVVCKLVVHGKVAQQEVVVLDLH